jgi:hypothetical protein
LASIIVPSLSRQSSKATRFPVTGLVRLTATPGAKGGCGLFRALICA